MCAACMCLETFAAEIVAHRGENTQAPENTLPAFRAAFANGGTAIEGDFYLTDSGEMVCVHGEKELAAYSGVERRIASLTRADLSKLDMAATSPKFAKFSPTPPPTVEEVFAVIPRGGKIFFEIKNYPKGFFEKLESARKSAGLEESQVVLISFNFDALKDAKKRNPRYKCYFLYSAKSENGRLLPTPSEIAAKVRSAGLDGVDVGHWNLDEAYVRALKSEGLDVAVWTLNDVSKLPIFVKWGADFITTDKNAEFLRALRKK